MGKEVKLTGTEVAILAQCCGDNPIGRIGWPLSVWEAQAKAACAPLVKSGMLKERRLGGYPGVEITPAGRAALEANRE
jgi:hypothetical protein